MFLSAPSHAPFPHLQILRPDVEQGYNYLPITFLNMGSIDTNYGTWPIVTYFDFFSIHILVRRTFLYRPLHTQCTLAHILRTSLSHGD